MDVLPLVIHISQGSAEGNVDGLRSIAAATDVSGGGPVEGVVELTGFVGDWGRVEHWVNCWRVGGIWVSSVIDNVLQFFGIG